MAENKTNAWFYWWAVDPYAGGGSFTHLDPVKKTYTYDKRLFTIGNYSRFIKPGYFRVQTNSELSTGVLVSAYKSVPDHKLVVVAINENVKPRELALKLKGTNASSAALWRTSQTEDLVNLKELRIAADSTLKATLAPGSVTTFVMSVTPAQ